MALVGLERLDAVAGFGHHAQIGFLVDDVGDAGPEQRVIVDEEHARLASGARDSFELATWTCVGQRAGSHASTTSVPLRGAVTMVSDAPMRSARSCMLVIPKPERAPLARDAAAIVGHRQPETDRAHRRRAHGDPPRAR